MSSAMSSNSISATAPQSPSSDSQSGHFNFSNSYVRLPNRFYSRLNPTPVQAPRLVKLNVQLAEHLGLNANELSGKEGIEILAGTRIDQGSEPLAMAYAGHQFGHFVPQLGDGRANLLGEVIGRDGVRYDIQLKGSGPTPFSRGGDGRAALGPVLREYVVSEAMAALGVPTTRALAAVVTGEQVFREGSLPGAVFTRVAGSHLRVGSFQYFAARGDVEAIRILADYAIARHYPSAARSAQPYRALLDGVISRQAALIAQWMLFGFIHGVMNTDNTSISGETIDYGPCAFMEAYRPDTVFSSIDLQGRYAYGNQPAAAHWNLARLAEALLPILEAELGTQEAAVASAIEALSAFEPQFQAAYLAGFRRKLGLFTEMEGDRALTERLLQQMADNRVDFTMGFRRLCDAASGPEGDCEVRKLFADPLAYDTWAAAWRERLAEESTLPQERAAAMRHANPVYIPRNHLVQAAIEAAVNQQDFQLFEKLLDVTSHPYDERPGWERYAAPARPEESVLQTFCGT
jgi:serine/tyrosine/threonine adenylyltransferase